MKRFIIIISVVVMFYASSTIDVLPQPFIDSGISLPGMAPNSAIWGDYDNDNDLDLAFPGIRPLKIYDGPSFTTQTAIPSLTEALYWGSSAWGDYDNDGDLDILVSGNYFRAGICRIYTNNGNKTFTEGASFPGVYYSSVAWGDYDNDGYLDILLTGIDYDGIRYAQLYRNNHNKTFSEQTGISLAAVSNSSVAWGDYDNDGYLDIILTGQNASGTRVAKIYKNTGNNSFIEQTAISLRGIEYGSVAWGDYDNDGDLDILLAGQEGDGNRITVIYRNNGNNSFTEQSEILLPGVAFCSVVWGDFDNDGDLDILITGKDNEEIIISRIYCNNANNSFSEESPGILEGVFGSSASWVDYDKDGDLDILLEGENTSGTKISKLYVNNCATTNKKPDKPVNLNYACPDSKLILKWDKIITDETSSNSMTYNVRMGRTSEVNNFVASHSASNGFRKIPAMGNAQLDTTFLYKYYWDTTYFASVQAVDNSFIGGLFSDEIQIKIVPVQPSDLYAINKSSNSILLKWKRGNGERCILFAKEGTTGSASPQSLSTYYANPVFAEGSPIGTTGWFCIYKGEADSVLLTGLNPLINYRIHALELQGTNGSELYAGTIAADNIGTFSTALFSEQSGLANVAFSSVAWGDYDKDGDLDALLTGTTVIGPTFNPVSKIYKNNGDNTFSDQTAIQLTGVISGSVAWGDSDNDGDLDILITGASYGKIYTNENNLFTELPENLLTGVHNSSVAWGDYDNDGDLDILLTGRNNSSLPVTIIYRNNGINVFTEQSAISLQKISYGSVAWGDYDNDGDLDILLSGATGDYPNYNPVSKIYRNDGNNLFNEQSGISLQGVYYGSIAWGDYDNDSDLDILITGATGNSPNYDPISKIYRNDGGNSFNELSELTLKGVYQSSVAWGDYDNDGDLDILLSGKVSNGLFTGIYNNNGNNHFTENTNIDFIDVKNCSVAWGDYDNDGDLDILLTGSNLADKTYSRIYMNNSIMKASSIKPNKKPDAPEGLTSEITPANIKLSWAGVINDETPVSSMSYNIRYRLDDETFWRCAPHSDENGFRRAISLGNIQLNKTFILNNWTTGTWEWQVQAIDQGYMGGPWSETNTFIVKNTQAFFKTDVVCQGLATQFTDQSIASDGIAAWRWDFKDGSTSVLQNPEHLFTAGGTYEVKLVITDKTGIKDSLEQSVVVKPKPIAGFSAPPVCQGTSTSIINTTNINGLTISSWYWDFGDGQTSLSEQPASHGYLGAADYTVVLKALADNSCRDSIKKTVTVASYPIAAVTAIAPLTFCKGDSVALSVPYNNDYLYTWKLNGTAVSGADSSRFVAKLTGSYTAEVVNSKGNCKTTSSATAITANDTPSPPSILTTGGTTLCQGDSVVLSVTITADYSYQWRLNGGSVGADSNIYIARSSGLYDLILANSTGCKATSVSPVPV
ncbi:MAG TPA: FG-GAP-like repeat-containing protein, partial [Bacteroidales bacterium]|nr:FG-GAP-like repeat-containing protein [Bacteroidales bacterium]